MLHKCGERVQAKSQKDFEANSYVERRYRGKTCRGAFLDPILNRCKEFLEKILAPKAILRKMPKSTCKQPHHI